MKTGHKNTPAMATICAAHGVQDVVIAPGSRSAPITLAFVRHKGFNCHTVIDERSAGYVALGIAQQSKRPVVIICTSGTAALNLSPALAEAMYSQVPIIALTADRPAAWINQDDGQSIQQSHIFDAFVIQSYNLEGDSFHEDDIWFVQRSLNEALCLAINKKGPVHINIPLHEPLYELPATHTETISMLQSDISSEQYNFNIPFPSAPRVWILAGQQDVDAETAKAIEHGIRVCNWVVITESLSNLPVAASIQNINEVLASDTDTLSAPNILISFGRSVVSKKLKQYLRSIPDLFHVHIDNRRHLVDTFRHLSYQVKGEPAVWLNTLIEKPLLSERDFFEQWIIQAQNKQTQLHTFAQSVPYSDWYIFHQLCSALPPDSILHIGNSSPVRYTQIFFHLLPASITYYGNRGVSGIDGVVSTAVGHALACPKKNHFLIVGDLSFQYDSNALWINPFPSNLTIIVINNRGGSIFRLIEGSKHVAELEDYFEMRQPARKFEHLAHHFGLPYMCCTNEKDLADLRENLSNMGAAIIEIQSDPELSSQTFADFYQYLRQNS
ncbi:MAG: 2-succinyl-5-enolpyruvyl-6-hydroxy-3-cyclohexene-1-carboxylic-acid synthase [Flavobacteriales bacterium]|nr:2-succinyl-5-enolpyruvyl-6-hydroxy-3-cyclohexene-1-carboxylic-acid synthase [Flavobacteriales bacterium]